VEAQETVLLESVSPNGNMWALVEQYEDCCYLYLHGDPETQLPLRSCWVRNLRPAPEVLDAARMREGFAPMLPSRRCAHPDGAGPLRPETLSAVWFEEGDGVALLEGEEILAVVPAWAGRDGFDGFARDCTEDGPLCWSLGTPESNVLFDRVRRASEWWASWDDAGPWRGIQDAGVGALERALGKHSKYYAIDSDAWPPKAMMRFECPGGVALATCGVAIRPQPGVETACSDPENYRRIELGIAVSDAVFAECGDAIMRYVSAQTNLPWTRYTWLGEGHTIPCDAFAGSQGASRFDAVLLASEPLGAPDVHLPLLRDDPVTLLWMVPITERERTLAIASGSRELLSRLSAAGHGWLHRGRAEVVG
jgi:hypothetical protein